MAAFEAVGVLGLDPSFGPAPRDGMPSFVEEPPAYEGDPIGHELELGIVEDRILAGARQLRIRGRADFVRAVQEHTRARWDRVLWFAGWFIDGEYAALHAIVSQLAEEGELPPVHADDLRRRYLELTQRHRVLLVMEFFPPHVTLLQPSAGSLLIETAYPEGNDGLDVALEYSHELSAKFDACMSEALVWEPEPSFEVASTFEQIAKVPARNPNLSEQQRRTLVACGRDVPGLNMWPEEEDVWRALWDPPGMVDRTIAALAPPQRAEFLDWWDSKRACDALLLELGCYRFDHLWTRVDSLANVRIEPHDKHLLELLVHLRPPRASLGPARQALYEWERHGGGDGLPAAVRRALRAELGVSPKADAGSPGSDPAGRLVWMLRHLDDARVGDLEALTLHEWDRTDGVALRHLAWSGLAWLHIQHARRQPAEAALAEAERSARAWASPFALLRVDLLRLEFDVCLGELARASEAFESLQERCTQLWGAVHPATMTLLARGVVLYGRSAHAVEARACAEACVQSLRYADKVPREVLDTLLEFYAEQGPEARVAALRERRRQLVAGGS